MSYEFFFERGDAALPTLLLLHGTGGDETQLVGLARTACPGAGILALRGTINENGRLRFFRRHADGILDEDDIRAKSADVAAFVETFSREKELGRRPVAIGYSNGANLAAAMMLSGSKLFDAAVLLRAVSPFARPPGSSLAGRRVCVVSGAEDKDIDARESRRLVRELSGAGADVAEVTLETDHLLGQGDVDVSAEFIRTLYLRT